MTAATPRLAAVQAWLDSGRQGDIPWPAETGERWPDPESWDDPAIRLHAALMQCGGARAELPRRVVVDRAGRRIPPPPTYRRGPHPRKPRNP